MIRSILNVLLFSTLGCHPFPAVGSVLQEPRTSVVSYNTEAMPIAINSAVAENRATDSWIAYSVTNKSRERIERIVLCVFIVDDRGSVVRVEESSSVEPINSGVTQADRAPLRIPIKQNGLPIVAVTTAVAETGVWSVAMSELRRAISNKAGGRPVSPVKVAFEEHVKVSDTDRAKIFKLLLEDLVNDDAKAERLKGRPEILVLSDNVAFDLPQITNIHLSKVDNEEIQRLADEKGRVFYLVYRPFDVEGARVLARVSLRDQRARKPGASIPYKFTYLFTLTKRVGNWTIEKSIGYAES